MYNGDPENNLYDYKVDMYSLGINLYYISTRNHPFRTRGMMTKVQLNAEGNISFTEQRFVELPLDLQDLIINLLHLNP